MKRSHGQRGPARRSGRNQEPDSESEYTDSSSASEATVETDLTEPDGPEQPAKRGRTGASCPIPSQSLRDDGGDFSDDPLDDTGLDLSAIPEDFDKADGTLSRRGRMEERWRRYCKAKLRERRVEEKWRDPKHALREASDNDIHRFLGWCLRLKRGKNRRHLKRTKKASSFKSDWRSFRQYYKKVTKNKMCDEDSSNVRRGIKFLIMEHGLDTQKGRKTPVYIEDMVPFNETILSTQEKKFWLGFERIQVCLYNTLGIFTIHRKNALLSLQYKDLQFSLQRDPKGDPPIPLVELTATGVKKFMGSTDLITFPLPEVIYGPSLVFCPLTYLFGMMFHAKAFQHPGLTSMAQLRKLFVRRGCQQMPLYLRHETADWYIFCETELVKGKPVIQRKKPMSKQKMGRLLVIFSEIHGWLHPLFSHQFRYGGGQILNESGWVSEEQRMLIMKHADRRTFIEHYHPRTVGTDMIRTMCNLDPDKELMRAVRRQDRWRDRRRPRYLTEEEKKSVESDPELVAAIHKLDTLKAEFTRTRNLRLPARIHLQEREVTNTRTRLLRALRKKMRLEFDEKQSFLDIEAQLSGNMVDDSEEEPPSEDDLHPILYVLLQKLLSTVSDCLEAEWRRRNEAVDFVVLYCDVPEGGPRRGRPKKTQPPTGSGEPDGGSPAKDVCEIKKQPSTHDELLRLTAEHIEKASKPRACFQCFADRKQPGEVRCRMFYDPGCLTRHFDSHHLEDEQCNWCELSVLHTMHLQRHAKDVHRTHSRLRPPPVIPVLGDD